MTNFVLVHGGSHGAWCWDRLVPHLRADPRVISVLAIDLPGHGARRDVKPLAAITLADYVDGVVREIESRDLQKVILVGHSLAGITMERDAALPPAFQREQAINANADDVVPFDAGHSAFVSRPRALAELLLRYVC